MNYNFTKELASIAIILRIIANSYNFTIDFAYIFLYNIVMYVIIIANM